jgi:hypothetical protein
MVIIKIIMNKETDVYYVISKCNKKKEIEKLLFESISKIKKIKKFVCIQPELITHETEPNLIKRAIKYFNYIWNTEKLKSTNDLWFVFVGKGDIPKMYSNIKLVIISENPSLGLNKFYYSTLKPQKKSKNIIGEVFQSKPLEYKIINL